MEWHEALILLIGCMLLLMAIGLPVALAFFGVNIVGAYLFLGGESGLSRSAAEFFLDFVFIYDIKRL